MAEKKAPAKRTTRAAKTATAATKVAPRKTTARKAAAAAPAVETAPEVQAADPTAEVATEVTTEAVPGELALGSEGADVKRLQRALGLKVDGVFGPATEKALKQFQKQRGRNMTGVVNERGWRDLRAAIDAG